MREKMALLAPIPSMRERAAVAVKPRLPTSVRAAYRRSWPSRSRCLPAGLSQRRQVPELSARAVACGVRGRAVRLLLRRPQVEMQSHFLLQVAVELGCTEAKPQTTNEFSKR